MAKRKSVKKATKVGSLPVRKDSNVKGGFPSAVGSRIKTLGAVLAASAQKQ